MCDILAALRINVNLGRRQKLQNYPSAFVGGHYEGDEDNEDGDGEGEEDEHGTDRDEERVETWCTVHTGVTALSTRQTHPPVKQTASSSSARRWLPPDYWPGSVIIGARLSSSINNESQNSETGK